ncbi:MAG: hypothetical protein SPD11_02920 [Sphaerochaetaceae bacterium]|nr:hypothetical protein [Sphaerochaetaceae bacterium]
MQRIGMPSSVQEISAVEDYDGTAIIAVMIPVLLILRKRILYEEIACR